MRCSPLLLLTHYWCNKTQMPDDHEPSKAIESAVADGLRGVLEEGLAHLSPEEREQWSDHAHGNLLLEASAADNLRTATPSGDGS